MFKDGSQAWEAKDFLLEQKDLRECSVENKVYHGYHTPEVRMGSLSLVVKAEPDSDCDSFHGWTGKSLECHVVRFPAALYPWLAGPFHISYLGIAETELWMCVSCQGLITCLVP